MPQNDDTQEPAAPAQTWLPTVSPRAPEPAPPIGSGTLDDQGALPGVATTPALDMPGSAAGPPLVHMAGYEILGELGRGGMGVVYRARHIKLKREVALKMILAGGHAGAQELARFHLEAAAVARLKHPHIIHIHEFGEHEGKPFFSLEFVEGGALNTRLKSSLLTPREAASLVEKLARAMQHAHDQGILHRDLKSANVLLTKAGEPKIADFGLAKLTDADEGLSHSGAIMGTPAYMSPEQAEGRTREIGPTSDVYALGVILYECLTGTVPFRGTTLRETLEMVSRQEPPSLRRQLPTLPRDLETICLRCMEKEIVKRYLRAQDLADDLGRFLRGEPVSARPVGTLGRGWRWCRRNPGPVAIIGLGAIALLAGVALLIGSLFANQLQTALDDAQEQKRLADQYRGESERLAALLTLRSGVALGDQGDGGRGLLWMARSLSLCPATAPELERGIRMALPSAAAALHTLEAVFTYPSPTTVVTISPDGQTLLFGGTKPILIDIVTGQPRDGREMALSGVAGAAFSPDGKLLAAASQKGRICISGADGVQDLESAIEHKGTIKSVAFRPDGKVLLVAAQFGTPLQGYDVQTRQPVGPTFACKDNLYAAVYSPDGKRVATAAIERNARLWDATTGEPIGPPLPHPGVVFATAFSPDGKTLVTGCLDGGVRFWEVETGKPVGPTLHHKGPVRSAVFNRDGRLVLTTSEDGTARVWEVESGRAVGQPLSHPAELRNAIFTPDDSHILTAGFEGTARLWRLAGEQSLARVLPHPGPVAAIAFSPNGKQVLTGCQESEKKPGESRLWDPLTGKPLGRPLPQEGQVLAVAFSPDGKTALTAGNDRNVRAWNTADSSPLGNPWPYGNIVTAIAYSPDGTRVAVGGRGGKVQLRDAATGRSLNEWEAYSSDMWVWSFAFTPDGRSILTSGGRAGRLWSVPDGQPIGEPMKHEAGVRTTVLSPDGEIVLTGSHDQTARLWSARDGQPLSPPLPHKGEVRAAAFRPDGKVVATAAADGTVRLWEVPGGRSLAPPLVHDGWVRSLAFSPDGKTLATGCDDGTARLWNADDGASLGAVLRHRGPVNRVIFGPDGKVILTASSDGTARLWTPPAPFGRDPAYAALWAQVVTGTELDAEGTVQVLPADAWQRRRQQLRELDAAHEARNR